MRCPWTVQHTQGVVTVPAQTYPSYRMYDAGRSPLCVTLATGPLPLGVGRYFPSPCGDMSPQLKGAVAVALERIQQIGAQPEQHLKFDRRGHLAARHPGRRSGQGRGGDDMPLEVFTRARSVSAASSRTFAFVIQPPYRAAPGGIMSLPVRQPRHAGPDVA